MDSMEKKMKMIQLLNLIQKLLNQIFVTTWMHIFFLTGDIAVVEGDQNTSIAFKNCVPFTRCATHMND